MSIEYRFIEPLDVLFLRGNKLFGDPGSFGECLVPPWPSVAAGAIRSRMLVDDRVDLAAFADNKIEHESLGTPANPGSFTLTGFHLARRRGDTAEVLMPPPADLVVSRDRSGSLEVSALIPRATALASSFPLEQPPVLAQGAERSKPESGYWLTQQGWADYLQGSVPNAKQLVHSSELWVLDARVGIGMERATRRVEEGKLFTAQAVAFKPGTGFVAAVSGARPPADGLLRLGGDGRAAAITPISLSLPQPDCQKLLADRRCRIVLNSPGLFPQGWKLPGTDADQRVNLPGGISARLVSAAVPRAETLSGWDLAAQKPKPAQKVVPAGSVYWLDELEATPEALGKLVAKGLWDESCEDGVDRARRAEGFNRISLAAWPNEQD